MRRVLLALTLACAGTVYGFASANAQSLYAPDADYEVDTYAVPADEDGGPKPRGPRVYGYYQADEPDFGRPAGSGGCGTYHFWNGEKCVDARNK